MEGVVLMEWGDAHGMGRCPGRGEEPMEGEGAHGGSGAHGRVVSMEGGGAHGGGEVLREGAGAHERERSETSARLRRGLRMTVDLQPARSPSPRPSWS